MRIFETRYVDMVGRCMREAMSVWRRADPVRFGSGVASSRRRELGTTARIVDFNTLPDGLLGITVQG